MDFGLSRFIRYRNILQVFVVLAEAFLSRKSKYFEFLTLFEMLLSDTANKVILWSLKTEWFWNAHA